MRISLFVAREKYVLAIHLALSAPYTITIRKGTYRRKPTFFNALPYALTAGRRAATAAMRRKEISCAEKIYFRRTEKIFPVQRKFASAASQSDFVSLPSRRGANVRFYTSSTDKKFSCIFCIIKNFNVHLHIV